jgi:hypothetical protein
VADHAGDQNNGEGVLHDEKVKISQESDIKKKKQQPPPHRSVGGHQNNAEDAPHTDSMKINQQDDVKKQNHLSSPHGLVCGMASCGAPISHLKRVAIHWSQCHSQKSLLKAVFLEVETGRKLDLLDLFPYVILCRVCKTVRHEKKNCNFK